MPNGIRLNKAIKELMKPSQINKDPKKGGVEIKLSIFKQIKEINAIKILKIGPTTAMWPRVLVSVLFLRITAPGAIILKNKNGKILINVSIAPILTRRNSAHNP